MSTEQKRNRVQLYLSDTYKDVIDKIREDNGWHPSDMTDKEMMKYILLDYQRLLEDYQELKEKLKYMDKNLSIVLNLIASMAMEYHIQPSPLEESLPYFQSKRYVESLMNLPRNIKPSPSIQRELQQPTKQFDESKLMEEKTKPDVPSSSPSTLDYSLDYTDDVPIDPYTDSYTSENNVDEKPKKKMKNYFL